MSYTDEEIAIVVHEMNRGVQIITNDPCPSAMWQVEDREIQEVVIESVRATRNGLTPVQLHDRWAAHKQEQGWRYGPVKDAIKKTHPNLQDYADLPPSQRIKDELFITVVCIMASQ